MQINNSWDIFFSSETKKDYYLDMINFLAKEYDSKLIFPPRDDIFNAFKLTDFKKLKVVILGQDPYHGENQAHGLAFSVQKGVKLPPSLKNIFKEIQNEYDYAIPKNGCLDSWASQGVLLLNSTLTVVSKTPNSHSKIGWQTFTDNVIKYISENKESVIFVLWGNFAKNKTNLIDENKHYILHSSHPSPFSAHQGFLGSNHFKEINNILKKLSLSEIDWKID